MTVYCRSTGFVFKKEDISESDRAFSVFTQDYGKIKVFARGIRKIASKLKSDMDIFSSVEMEFVQGKSKKTITDAVALERFKNIGHSPKRFEAASKISEIIDGLVQEHGKDSGLMSLINEAFKILDSESLKKEQCDILYYYFAWKFFCLLGFAPQLCACANCSKKLSPWKICFSCEAGGIVCGDCSAGEKKQNEATPDAVKILRLICKENWQTVSRIRINQKTKNILQEITENYYFYLADK